MKLEDLLKGIGVHDYEGNLDLEVTGLAYDSRVVKSGFLFVALRGHAQDGHDFIKEAIRNGAVAVVAESVGDVRRINSEITMIQVPDSRAALSLLSVKFYGKPFRGMRLVGITGTNGKTTTSYILESILFAAGKKPGVIGTVNYRFAGQIYDAPVTTPESLELMRILRRMADAGVTDVIIEVSSHALDQRRTTACPFEVAIFTNISRDHLDYHASMEEYFEAKSLLFLKSREERNSPFTNAVINTDDPKGKDLAGLTDFPVMSYGLNKECDVRAEQIRATRSGLSARLKCPAGEVDMQSRLIGGFNMYNILAASAAALCMGVDLKQISAGIARLDVVPGRMEPVKNRRSMNIIVDYAHTPDALEKALKTVKPLVDGRLISVFGCGGDRDKGKRWEMGHVAGELSDLVVITTDNPRTEASSAIAFQIEEGVRDSGLKKLERIYRSVSSEFETTKEGQAFESGYVIEPDRASAIRIAVRGAGRNDLVLIAGKGHEDYQIIGTKRRHFDDRKVAAAAVSEEF